MTGLVLLGAAALPAAAAEPTHVSASAPEVTAASRVIELTPGVGALQAAVDQAMPGDVLQLHSGTYTGQVFLRTSGTADAPIVIEPFGDGPVTVTATFQSADCAASQPNGHRTLVLREGVDYWTIRGLRIINGIWVSGTNFAAPAGWIKTQAKSLKDWKTRRALPGRGYVDGQTAVADPASAPQIYSALSDVLGLRIDPATGVRIVGNDISGRGVHVAVGERGAIVGNTIHDISCGIGPGIWLNTYSDFWQVTDNAISRVASSTYRHYMQEGIRTGSASSYNTITGNTVSDLPGDGRGITTDIDASFNRFEHNTVTGAAMGFNDQQSGWGNIWRYNLTSDMRGSSMAFRGADASLTVPSYNSSTLRAVVECNVARGTGSRLTAGALISSTFVNNSYQRVGLSKNLKTYWTDYNNLWDGSSALPPGSPPPPPVGSCPSPGA
ncbi:MAG TPA: right-handed parallel beta-helix repeat-containing protein [Dermatophilaceae bacterium]|nr:right-handed parallel beta-helix repeat-containing protein [Dermatophilaceae bacterium]